MVMMDTRQPSFPYHAHFIFEMLGRQEDLGLLLERRFPLDVSVLFMDILRYSRQDRRTRDQVKTEERHQANTSTSKRDLPIHSMMLAQNLNLDRLLIEREAFLVRIQVDNTRKYQKHVLYSDIPSRLRLHYNSYRTVLPLRLPLPFFDPHALIHQMRKRLRERRSQTPIAQGTAMLFERRIDDEFRVGLIRAIGS